MCEAVRECDGRLRALLPPLSAQLELYLPRRPELQRLLLRPVAVRSGPVSVSAQPRLRRLVWRAELGAC